MPFRRLPFIAVTLPSIRKARGSGGGVWFSRDQNRYTRTIPTLEIVKSFIWSLQKSGLLSLWSHRRASGATLEAFYQACEGDKLQDAARLLLIWEDELRSASQGDPQDVALQELLKAQARLWFLRCKLIGDTDEDVIMPRYLPGAHQSKVSGIVELMTAWLRGPQPKFNAAELKDTSARNGFV